MHAREMIHLLTAARVTGHMRASLAMQTLSVPLWISRAIDLQQGRAGPTTSEWAPSLGSQEKWGAWRSNKTLWASLIAGQCPREACWKTMTCPTLTKEHLKNEKRMLRSLKQSCGEFRIGFNYRYRNGSRVEGELPSWRVQSSSDTERALNKDQQLNL